MITKVVMPPLGETMDEGTIVRWLKNVGDNVSRGDSLIEVETDKVIVTVESFGAGILRKIFIDEGETVPVGALLAIISDPNEDIAEY